ISAKKGTNVDALLDQILLQAELLDLKANPDRKAQGSVLDASLDPGKGALATILVQNGTLRVGDDFICGQYSVRVRAMYDERGGPESDVLLARASGAIIVGFHVRPDSNARAAADRERVEIRNYRIIYEAVEEVKLAMEGLLAPEKKEVVLGEAEVRQIFKIAKIGTIAGCFVRSGVIPRTGRVRVIRNGVEVYDGTLASLKRFKDDVREVREGFECGIGIEN